MNELPMKKTLRMKRLWQEALQQLDEVQNHTDTLPPHIAQAALLQCFQRAMFLGFKTVKAYLKEEGYIPLTPKQHLEMALLSGWIAPEDTDAWWVLLMSWLEITEIYEADQAGQIEKHIQQYGKVLPKLFSALPY